MLINIFPLPGVVPFDWLGELVETQVIWLQILSWLQPDAETISASFWHKDACLLYTELHSLSPLHYKSFFFSVTSTAKFIVRHCISMALTIFLCSVLEICRFLAWAMDISSTQNQNCWFELAYSVLRFVLFVLSTQPEINAAEKNTLRNKDNCLPGWLTGENLHTKWSLRPSVALRAHWLLHSRQNRCFLERHPCDQVVIKWVW